MLVDEVMCREVVTLTPEATLRSAIELMDERGIRHVPIVDAGEVVGIVSERDLLEATGWFVQDGSASRLVRELMREPVKTAAPDDRLVSTSLELVFYGIGCLPVIEHGHLVGIVSEVDLIAAFVKKATAHELSPEENPLVEAVMTRKPTTVAPSDTVQDARDKLRSIRARHLPVVDPQDQRLVGIVSDRDLRWAEGRALDPSTPLEDLMSDFVVTIEPHVQLSLAASRILEHRFGALAVVDEGELVGILTTLDLLEHCFEALWRD